MKRFFIFLLFVFIVFLTSCVSMQTEPVTDADRIHRIEASQDQVFNSLKKTFLNLGITISEIGKEEGILIGEKQSEKSSEIKAITGLDAYLAYNANIMQDGDSVIIQLRINMRLTDNLTKNQIEEVQKPFYDEFWQKFNESIN